MKRKRGFDFWFPTALSVFAVVFAGLAGLFTGLLWHETREHDRLSLMPSIDFYTEDDDSSRTIGVQVVNNGPGPAIVRPIRYYVDRKLVKDSDEAAKFCGVNPDLVQSLEYEEGDSVAVGEKTWVFYLSNKNKKLVDRFITCIDDRLGVEVEYRRLGGDWQKKCSSKGRCGNS